MARAVTIEGSLAASDDESSEGSPAITVIAAPGASGASHVYLVLSLVLGALVATTSAGELVSAQVLGLVGTMTFVALGSAVMRLRAQDAPTWVRPARAAA